MGCTGVALFLALSGPARSQERKPEAAAVEGRAHIQAEYLRERQEVERRRLERLARLAESQEPSEAQRTYEDYFRSAIEAGLFAEAEPVAERVLADEKTEPGVRTLAVVANFVAEADRGAYDESLKSLAKAMDAAEADPAGAARRIATLPLATRLSVLEAYYQKLVQADEFGPAREAMRLISERAREPALKEYAAARLKQLDLIGKPAPAIAGRDVDGEPVSLGDEKGCVVLVVFWATWCAPCAEEAVFLNELAERFGPRGLRIMGVNLDASSDPNEDTAAVLPEVRRFLVEHNVRWPNLINGTGDWDYAEALGVTAIPANVLIGRDGTLIHLDLAPTNMERVIEKALAP
jgi:thiol-disulfide isomerase/thioredoxin